MEYKISFQKRFNSAFPNLLNQKIYEIGLNQSGVPEEPNYGKSRLNTPYWDHIKFTYEAEDSQIENYSFPNDPIVDAYLRKRSTVTEIFGGGSVIESSSVEPASFRLRGVLWNNDGIFPEEQLADLLECFRESKEIELVSSRYFNMLGVTELFIESVSLPGIAGYSDSQPFVITMREVNKLELNLKQTD